MKEMNEERKWNLAYWMVFLCMILLIILFRMIQVKYNHV